MKNRSVTATWRKNRPLDTQPTSAGTCSPILGDGAPEVNPLVIHLTSLYRSQVRISTGVYSSGTRLSGQVGARAQRPNPHVNSFDLGRIVGDFDSARVCLDLRKAGVDQAQAPV